ncbi:PREDICTED: LIRP isoform X2 [Wasmannia auropunctata]|uniref:LIRP isoform X2 n=1 Tax=Wasmannia auropunctata TaxID=64793 RepID=UPI0005ED92EB|nr:PREDICTED: LIRP isoform X2 [Wasmannia auropunctata]
MIQAARSGGKYCASHHTSSCKRISEAERSTRLMSQMSANRLNVLMTLMLAVALLVTESRNAQVDGYSQYESIENRAAARKPQHKYCGMRLSSALQIVCAGNYNAMFKKNGQGQEMEMADYPVTYELPPFLPRTKVLQGLFERRFDNRRYHRNPRGIHEECCLRGCTILELTSYCGPPEAPPTR